MYPDADNLDPAWYQYLVREQVKMGKKKSTQEVKSALSGEISSEGTAIFSNPEVASSGGRITGEIDMTGENDIDPKVIDRLRSSILSSSELYREAQHFQSQNIDVSSLVLSHTTNIAVNTIEILRLLQKWDSRVISRISDDDEWIRATAGRYVLAAIQDSWPSILTIVDEFLRISAEKPERYRDFADKIRIQLYILLHHYPSEAEDIYLSLSHLCRLLDPAIVNRMLYDPTVGIRIAAIRSLMERTELSVDDLSMTLILLKERNEQVNLVLMKLYARFAPCPEMVIPQILPILCGASAEMREGIFDVFRSYGNHAVEPLIAALNDTNAQTEAAVTQIIAQSPLKYTDALLHALVSIRTRDDVRKKLERILRSHQDPGRKPEILRTLNAMFDPEKSEYPEWQAPQSNAPKYLEPAVSNEDVYTTVLDSAGIKLLSGQCPDEALIRLLNDASEYAKINALHLIAFRGKIPEDAVNFIQMWIKSPDLELSNAALDAFCALEKDDHKRIEGIVNAIIHTDSDEVRVSFVSAILKSQTNINALLDLYYESPKRYENFLLKILKSDPSKESMNRILAGIQRDKSVECVAETVFCLLRVRCRCDSPKMREQLLSLVKNPVSFGHYGTISRINSLKLLKIWISEDEPKNKDQKTVHALIDLFNQIQNSEIREIIRDLLKFMDEEDAISGNEDGYE